MKYVRIEMENGDVMRGELYPDIAPKTVENFVKLVEDGFYDGLIFHRVIRTDVTGYFRRKHFAVRFKSGSEFISAFVNKNIRTELPGLIFLAETFAERSLTCQFRRCG